MSIEDFNDKNCLGYDTCIKYSDDKNLYCEDCDHRQRAIEPDEWFYHSSCQTARGE